MGRDSEKGKYAAPEGSHFWEYIVTVVCALGTGSIGATLGWISPSLAELTDPDLPNPLSPEDASTIAGAYGIGCLPAPILSLLIIDRIGKKKTIMIAGILAAMSWGVIVAFQNTWVLILTRVVIGCSGGLLMFSLPIYMGEILSTNLRGSMMTGTLISFNCGISFMLSVGPYLGIRATSSICVTVWASCVVGICFAPESPYHLVKVGRIEEAETALIKLRGKKDVADELEMIKVTLRDKGETLLAPNETVKDSAAQRQNAFKQIFRIRGNLKSFIIMILIHLMRQWSGLGSFLSYCEIIFGAMSAEIDVKRASMLFGLIQIISACITFVVVDKFNRKTLILTCGVAVSFFLTVFGAYFFIIEYVAREVQQYYLIPYISTFIYLIVLNVGVLAVPSVLASEILAPEVKGPIFCIVGVMDAIVGFFFAKFYLLSATSWGLGHSVPLLSYAVLTLFSIALIIRLLPETRGKTLLEIQKSFNA